MGLGLIFWAWIGACRVRPAWLAETGGDSSGMGLGFLGFGVAAVPEHPDSGFSGLTVSSEADAKGWRGSGAGVPSTLGNSTVGRPADENDE